MTMTGRISPNGILHIERVNKQIEQICPFSNPDLDVSCSHHCPFFEELDNIFEELDNIFEELDNVYDGDYGNRGKLKSRRISVCGKIIEINEDERE